MPHRQKCLLCHQRRALPGCRPEYCFVWSTWTCRDCFAGAFASNQPCGAVTLIIRFLDGDRDVSVGLPHANVLHLVRASDMHWQESSLTQAASVCVAWRNEVMEVRQTARSVSLEVYARAYRSFHFQRTCPVRVWSYQIDKAAGGWRWLTFKLLRDTGLELRSPMIWHSQERDWLLQSRLYRHRELRDAFKRSGTDLSLSMPIMERRSHAMSFNEFAALLDASLS